MKPLPPTEILRQLLRYDPETGKLFWRERDISFFPSETAWKIWNKRWPGKEAFTAVEGGGYLHGTLLGEPQRAHRLIWKMIYGFDPGIIDHDDRNRRNNRIGNLVSTTKLRNSRNQKLRSNNTSGINGVSFDSNSGKWKAQIRTKTRNKHIGLFDSLDAATAARKKAERGLGYHKNHGRAVV